MAEFRYEVIIVDTVEDAEKEGKPYKRVTDTAGLVWNFRAGQYDKLKAKWGLIEHGMTLRLLLGKYKGFDYIEDFDTIIDTLAAEKAKREAEQARFTKEGSIEAQTAAKIISELEIAGKDMSDNLLVARDNWLSYALRHYMDRDNGKS